jgi:predicted nucleotidyltransferase component of viral defense system
MTERGKDIGASVRARLLRLARERGDDFQLLLIRYANERLLYRISKSRHASDFVLKGATLFTVWTGEPHRSTRDLDLLGFGDPSEERIQRVMEEILVLDVEDDGIRFDTDSLEIGPIRERQEYDGIRIVVTARLTTAQVRLQVDIGFGDAITPDATLLKIPTLLDFPGPLLRVYPRETVVAEKLDAIVQLGLANSRMKDFYDLAVLARKFEFDGELLVRAIRATFERRGTPVPTKLPAGLSSEFAEDAQKRTQWTAFLRKTGAVQPQSLESVIAEVRRFAEQPLSATAGLQPPPRRWPPGGPWL